MIDHFTKDQFEKELPVDKNYKPLWQYAGFEKGEHTYLVHPFPKIPYGILVCSSVGSSNTSKGTGEDSIRARIVKIEKYDSSLAIDYTVHGGKNQQHVNRRKGWGERMRKMLRKLAGQCQYCQPCPFCGHALVPFTVHSEQSKNKGRCFVKCCSPECQTGDNSRVFIFTENEKGSHVPLDDNPKWKELKEQSSDAPPNCPECNYPMKRMSTNLGWRCNVPGNVYNSGRWSICSGVIWDDPNRNQTKPIHEGNKPQGNYKELRKLVDKAFEELDNAHCTPEAFYGGSNAVKELYQYLKTHN